MKIVQPAPLDGIRRVHEKPPRSVVFEDASACEAASSVDSFGIRRPTREQEGHSQSEK